MMPAVIKGILLCEESANDRSNYTVIMVQG